LPDLKKQYPTFKKKQNAQSATSAANAFKWENGQLTLAKMAEPLALVFHRDLPKGCKPSSVTVSKDCADRSFVSLLIEEEIKPLPEITSQVGLDLGLKAMVILSTGEAVGNPRYSARDEKRLTKAQRRHARKKKGSQNRNKARLKVARVHARLHDQHKLSTSIVNENQVICIESLAVKNLLKNHYLAKAISDVGWGVFLRQLEEKSQWYGRALVPNHLTFSLFLARLKQAAEHAETWPETFLCFDPLPGDCTRQD
jgi:putative transposase